MIGDEFNQLERALNDEIPVSVRINRSKGINAPKGGSPVAWCDSGYYLPERLSFTFDPIFHAGGYYV
ncbi:tRNA and rRNA cytosine-C5-methylase, partial [gut metagenome]